MVLRLAILLCDNLHISYIGNYQLTSTPLLFVVASNLAVSETKILESSGVNSNVIGIDFKHAVLVLTVFSHMAYTLQLSLN